MAQLTKLDTQSIGSQVIKGALKGMLSLTTDVKKRCEELAPTDTREYIQGFKTTAKIEGLSVVGEVINDSDHASGVETGFQRGPVRWHKGPPRNDSTTIYVGVGAHVQQRASQEFISKAPKILGSNQ